MIKKECRFLEMSAQQYRELLGLSKPIAVQKESKYHAKKTEVDGITFDSQKEGRQWKELCLLEAGGSISNLRRQVAFELQPKYITKDGRKICPITYVADFVYEKDGVTYVQDSKGMRTDVYKLKRKMFEYKYPDYVFIES